MRGLGVEIEAMALVGVDASYSNNLLDILQRCRSMQNWHRKKHSHVQFFLKGRFKVVIMYLLVTGLVVGTEVMALVGVALQVI